MKKLCKSAAGTSESPLRRRMIEDMAIRKLAPKIQQGYIRFVKDFAAFLGRSPDTASFEDVRRFQLHLAATGAHVPMLHHAVAALRFFFKVTFRSSTSSSTRRSSTNPASCRSCSAGRKWRSG
jgi:hypothetical protein